MAGPSFSLPVTKSVLLCLLVMHPAYCQEAQEGGRNTGISGPKVPINEKLMRELREVTDRLIVVEKGEPQEILPLCSREGVVFGVDGPQIRLSAIREQITKRQGVYCLLFDTNCLRKEQAVHRARARAAGESQPVYSYRELFEKASVREVKIFVDRDQTSWSGQVTILLSLKGGPIDYVPARNPMEFILGYERGKWKLTAVPYF